MIIATDLDGCLADHDAHFCAYAARHYGVHLTPATLPTPTAATTRAYRHIFEDAEYWRTLPAWHDAATYTRRIVKELGATLRVFTFRPDYGRLNLRRLTLRWLERCNITYSELVVEQRRPMRYDEPYPLFVEDSPGNAWQLAQEPATTVLLMEHAYNGNAMPANVRRVSCWRDVYDAAKELCE
jgi:uncharacterized HAD superfamily protein